MPTSTPVGCSSASKRHSLRLTRTTNVLPEHYSARRPVIQHAGTFAGEERKGPVRETKINHLAVWILVLAHQALGCLWYARFLFGDIWLVYLGRSVDEVNPWNPVPFVWAIIAAIAFNYTLAWLFRRLNIVTAVDGLKVSAVVWFAFLFPAYVTHGVLAGVPYGVLWIDMGKELVAYGLSGILLGGWVRYETGEA